jgi:hypothetical protein
MVVEVVDAVVVVVVANENMMCRVPIKNLLCFVNRSSLLVARDCARDSCGLVVRLEPSNIRTLEMPTMPVNGCTIAVLFLCFIYS